MPVYDYQDPISGKVISVLVTLDQPDSARHTQEQDGVVYKRLYSAPLAAHDTTTKDGTKADFKRITDGKNVKVGDLWKIAGEMSEQRSDKQGRDEVKEQFYTNYRKETGDDHHDVKKRRAMEESNARLKELGIRLE